MIPEELTLTKCYSFEKITECYSSEELIESYSSDELLRCYSSEELFTPINFDEMVERMLTEHLGKKPNTNSLELFENILINYYLRIYIPITILIKIPTKVYKSLKKLFDELCYIDNVLNITNRALEVLKNYNTADNEFVIWFATLLNL